MPANEFEKQVQQQMDDFQLNPSASVWKKVEKQIQKKKRRRIIFFILLPVFLGLLGYSIYHYLYTGQKNYMAQQPVAAKNEKSVTVDKRHTSIETKEQFITPSLQNTDKPVVSIKKNVIQKKNAAATTNNELEISLNNPTTDRIKNKQPIKEEDEIKIEQKKLNTSPVINNKEQGKDGLSITINNSGTVINIKKTEATSPVEPTNNKKDTAVTSAKDLASIKTDSVKNINLTATDNKKEVIAKKKISKSKIKWGIDFTAGISGITSGAFALGGNNAAMDLFTGNPAGATGSSQAVRTPPSSINPGLSFKLGIVGELKLSNKSSFSAGLKYVYASNSVKAGGKSDTAIRINNNLFSLQTNDVYRGTPQNNYTNSFHFIQIPIAYHLQINKGKKIPVQWNGGLSFSFLIASNGLVYDTAYNGIYYRNKNAFNKTHFNLSTGLSFRLKNKNGMEWVLGPEISFDMSKLINNPFDKKQYLLFGGINTKLFFTKKKK
jgi:hypothetical protein